MTKDIEGKVREILENLYNSHSCENTQWEDKNNVDKAFSSILFLTIKAELRPLTRGEFRCIMCEFKPTIAEDSGQPEWSQGELDKAWDFLTGEKRSILTHGQDKVELDEKEVERVLLELDKYIGVSTFPKENYKIIAQNICSHFSKPVIKYPEKKEAIKYVRERHQYDTGVLDGEVIGYNQAIDDMRRINGDENENL